MALKYITLPSTHSSMQWCGSVQVLSKCPSNSGILYTWASLHALQVSHILSTCNIRVPHVSMLCPSVPPKCPPMPSHKVRLIKLHARVYSVSICHVCVCVKEKEREREWEKDRNRVRETVLDMGLKDSLPFFGMVMSTLFLVGNMEISKAAMSAGMNPYILVVYSSALTTLIFLPYSYNPFRSFSLSSSHFIIHTQGTLFECFPSCL